MEESTSLVVEKKWIVSRNFDVLIFGTPLLLGLLVTPIALHTYPTHIPLWAFVAIIIAFDVAHVWATAYRIFLDRAEYRRRFWFYTLPIPVSFAVALVIHLFDPLVYWTVLAYVAIVHFIRQPYGFVAMYKSRFSEYSTLDYRLDKWSVWCAALGPLLWWHASPQRVFDWFDAGEFFLVRVPKSFVPYIAGVYLCTALIYVARQVYLWRRRDRINIGKIMVMGGTWLTWAIGIAVANPLVSAAFLNLFHAIPFLGVLWVYCTYKWSSVRPDVGFWSESLMQRIFARRSVFLFFLVVFLPALIEEICWDASTWHVYLPFEDLQLSDSWSSLWVALLSVPQIVHYWTDTFIWKFNRSNPDLKHNLGL